jgi:hypothetical protein
MEDKQEVNPVIVVVIPDVQPGVQLGVQYSDSNLEKLVIAMNMCTDDGIPCSICPVYTRCLAWWDRYAIGACESNIAKLLKVASYLKEGKHTLLDMRTRKSKQVPESIPESDDEFGDDELGDDEFGNSDDNEPGNDFKEVGVIKEKL